MQLTADQELRRELLLFSLSKQPDLRSAINLAAQMEQFVLKGCLQLEEAAGRAFAAAKGSSAGQPTDRTETERPSNSHDLRYLELNGTAASPPTPNHDASSACSTADRHDTSGGSQKRRWSKGDDERLQRLWYSDHSLDEIAEAMGRTTPSLYSRARALGIPKRSPLVDKREPARPNRGGRESASAGGALAPAGEDDIPGESGRQADALASKTGRTEVEGKHHCPPRAGNGERPHRIGSAVGGGREAKRNGSAVGNFLQSAPLGTSVEPAIHFLRSRDYSVVRVEDGRFRLDGRRVLSADELREKADQVRQSMGKPPYTPQSIGPAG